MKVGTAVTLKNPDGDDTCLGLVEGNEGNKVKVVYWPATSATEHRAFDASELTPA